jgi:predicted nucleotidyltransferase
MGTTETLHSGPSLFGQTRSALLGLFFGHPEQQFYLRQLSRVVGAGHGALQRELKNLTDMGLIVRTQQGNQVMYRANSKSAIFGEMKRLVAKTLGTHDKLRTALAPLGRQIRIAFVYGSIARQTERPGSDVDLMVLGDAGFGDVVAALGGVQKQLGREVNPTVFPLAEFRSKLAAGNHFLRSVMAGKKLFVVGTENELAKLVEERLAGATRKQSARNR